MISIDELDKQILKLLQHDARIPFAELSRVLGIAETTVRFRVNRLVQNGIITRFTALLDHAKLGMNVSGAILLKIDPAHLEEVCNQLMSFKETQFLFQSTGEYDVVSIIITWDMENLSELVKKTKLIPGVKDARVSVTTRFLKFNPIVEL
jgi:DNA-binding Lrp family transcriptional regulator